MPDTDVLTRTHRGLRAGRVVGILATPRQSLEILPKIDREDGAVRASLVRLLAVAQDLRVGGGDLASLDTQRQDLLEIFVRLFAARLAAELRRGLPRRYLAHAEDLRLLRGRLDSTRQFTNLAVRDTDGGPLFALRPDAVVEGLIDSPVVLDTKWKRVTPRKPSCEKTMGVTQSDIYQMLVYANAYDAKRLVLVYPWHAEMGELPGPNRFWTVTGTDRRLNILTIDVGHPHEVVETLRGIFSLK